MFSISAILRIDLTRANDNLLFPPLDSPITRRYVGIVLMTFTAYAELAFSRKLFLTEFNS